MVRATLAAPQDRARPRDDAVARLSRYVRSMATPAALAVLGEVATDEMPRCVGGLGPDAAKEKDKVRATLAAPGERALATRDASLSLAPSAAWPQCLCTACASSEGDR